MNYETLQKGEFSESQIPTLFEYLPKQSGVILLKGNLGSGKTTFTRAYINELTNQKTISSPTFGLINQYKAANSNIYHLDLYRLESKQSLESIGLYELLDSVNTLIIIEWPEILGKIEHPHFLITLSHCKFPEKREIILQRTID